MGISSLFPSLCSLWSRVWMKSGVGERGKMSPRAFLFLRVLWMVEMESFLRLHPESETQLHSKEEERR